MIHDKRLLATFLAATMLLAGLGQLVPPASATGCGTYDNADDQFPQDIEADDNAWVRSSNPASDQVQASRLMNLFLFRDGSGVSPDVVLDDPVDATNGVDGYVHDLGCETQTQRDWCLDSIRDDKNTGLVPTDESQQLLTENRLGDNSELRTDDWRVAFYSASAQRLGPVAEVSDTQKDDLCEPSETLDAENSQFIPTNTRYIVIWLDSSDVLGGETDMDTVENLLPRGYQTRSHLYSTYNAQIAFNVCFDQFTLDTDRCD